MNLRKKARLTAFTTLTAQGAIPGQNKTTTTKSFSFLCLFTDEALWIREYLKAQLSIGKERTENSSQND